MRNCVRLCCYVLVLSLAMTAVSCSRDPNVVKVKYLQNGNRYFEKGKYKEAYIMYRNALKKDPKYSEAYYRVGLAELRMQRWQDAARDFQPCDRHQQERPWNPEPNWRRFTCSAISVRTLRRGTGRRWRP